MTTAAATIIVTGQASTEVPAGSPPAPAVRRRTGRPRRSELDRLPPRERRILAMRFGQQLTQSEIAVQVGVSQMQISRLLQSSLTRLRTGMRPAGAGPKPAPQRNA
jgi:DNA-directed RNA polymerase specialized sigma24 family protein